MITKPYESEKYYSKHIEDPADENPYYCLNGDHFDNINDEKNK
jgi:hypothetical protein